MLFRSCCLVLTVSSECISMSPVVPPMPPASIACKYGGRCSSKSSSAVISAILYTSELSGDPCWGCDECSAFVRFAAEESMSVWLPKNDGGRGVKLIAGARGPSDAQIKIDDANAVMAESQSHEDGDGLCVEEAIKHCRCFVTS